jgi:hypothetical protein
MGTVVGQIDWTRLVRGPCDDYRTEADFPA